MVFNHLKMKILICTFNRGKQKEFGRILKKLAKKDKIDLELLFPQDLELKDKVRETGRTFKENSTLKAKFFFGETGLPTIADDGGLEIEVLGGEPGVKSRRWRGDEGEDEELIDYALKRLKKYQKQKERRAYLKACITFFDGENTIQETEKIKGYIARKTSKRRIKGYPFRALFVVLPIKKYYDQLSKKEHEKYNHRERALKKLWRRLKLLYNI